VHLRPAVLGLDDIEDGLLQQRAEVLELASRDGREQDPLGAQHEVDEREEVGDEGELDAVLEDGGEQPGEVLAEPLHLRPLPARVRGHREQRPRPQRREDGGRSALVTG